MNQTTNTRLAISLITLAGAAAAAHADDYRRYFVPDYDQLRSAIFDVEGLPGGGAAWCSPTAATNQFSYLAKRGFPLLVPGPDEYGPEAPLASYNQLTEWLEVVGNEFGTDPIDGTQNSLGGYQTILEAGAPGQFTITRLYPSGTWAPRASHLALHAVTGGLVNMGIGWWSGNAADGFTRDGGHVVSLNGLDDFDTTNPTMRWRDPANDSANIFAQSDYVTNSSDTVEILADFDGNERRQDRLIGYSSPAFIDGYFVIRPKFAVIPNFPNSGLDFVTPNPVTPDGPTIQSFQLPSGQDPGCIALGGDLISALATGVDSGGMHTFYQLGFAPDGTPIRATLGLLLPAVQAIETCRDCPTGDFTYNSGDFFVLADGLLRKYDNRGSVPTQTFAATGHTLTDFTTAKGAVMGLSTGGDIVLFDDNLDAFGRAILPNPADIGPDANIDEAPDGTVWVFSGDTAYNYDIAGPRGGAVLIDSFDTSLFESTADIDHGVVEDNGMITLSVGGVLHTAAKVETARPHYWTWDTTRRFHGLATGGAAFEMSYSHTNFQAGVHDTAQWNELLPTEFPTPVPTCPWDIDGDGLTTFNDLNILLDNWGEAGFTGDPGDVNGDGDVNFDDLNQILEHWGESCR